MDQRAAPGDDLVTQVQCRVAQAVKGLIRREEGDREGKRRRMGSVVVISKGYHGGGNSSSGSSSSSSSRSSINSAYYLESF